MIRTRGLRICVKIVQIDIAKFSVDAGIPLFPFNPVKEIKASRGDWASHPCQRAACWRC